jgi:hypothetical protein
VQFKDVFIEKCILCGLFTRRVYFMGDQEVMVGGFLFFFW